MLKIDRLSTSYKTIHGDVRVVNNLDFTINDNEIFGIAGESGCGKSTLLKALYDIIDFPMQVDSGRVILSGERKEIPSILKPARFAKPGGTTFPMCRRRRRA